MLYLTCTTITSIDLAHYGVSRAKDWVSVKCGTNGIVPPKSAYQESSFPDISNLINLHVQFPFESAEDLVTKFTSLIRG